jgi:hypothetical protein
MKNFKKFLCVWMVFSLMILCGGNQIVYAVTPTEIFNYYDVFYTTKLNTTTKKYYLYGIPLMWSNKNGNLLKMRINTTTYMTSSKDNVKNFKKAVEANYGQWNTTGYCDAAINQSSGDNIYISCPTENYWEKTLGGESEVFGITVLYDTNGAWINNAIDANNSTKQIRSGIIYMNPNATYNDANNLKKTVIHELGHCLCLGHPVNWGYDEFTGVMNAEPVIKKNVTSVMHQGEVELAHVSSIVTTYDKNQLKYKYGFTY